MAGARVGTPRAHRAAQSTHVDYVPYYVSLPALSLCILLWVLTEREPICVVLCARSFCATLVSRLGRVVWDSELLSSTVSRSRVSGVSASGSTAAIFRRRLLGLTFVHRAERDVRHGHCGFVHVTENARGFSPSRSRRRLSTLSVDNACAHLSHSRVASRKQKKVRTGHRSTAGHLQTGSL